MKQFTTLLLLVILFFSACSKSEMATGYQMPSAPLGFTTYLIKAGKNYCEGNNYKPVELEEQRFVVRFDSSCIYTTLNPANQNDINKLYGFSDNGQNHHMYSARFGWRWSEGAL